jgi:hypothetical protein
MSFVDVSSTVGRADCVGFEVLTAVSVRSAVFCGVRPCNLVG